MSQSPDMGRPSSSREWHFRISAAKLGAGAKFPRGTAHQWTWDFRFQVIRNRRAFHAVALPLMRGLSLRALCAAPWAVQGEWLVCLVGSNRLLRFVRQEWGVSFSGVKPPISCDLRNFVGARDRGFAIVRVAPCRG